ncbi:MAG: nucleotidyl transferase AbiEii/AbiGii toxin family protein [Thermodesulfobacteriota bacterium]|nr:nucleotidyl transferase AbiEii/AbiGii toxin family protein [Thermodesulfobacteriota bacterium]
MTIVDQLLDKYSSAPPEKQNQALREVMQKIALAGLNRTGFFEKSAFYGGTCLRIFYNLPRFSEDLDFSLLRPEPDFSLQPYLQSIKNEFTALGLDIDIVAKTKSTTSQIESAFLKNNTQIFNLGLRNKRQLKIKLEVDTLPPLKFTTEEKLLLQPFSFYVKCFSLPDLFAGKMHALLFRQWKNRVKGRDWYDFEWYLRNGVELNLTHFNERALQSGNLTDRSLTPTAFLEKLQAKIASLDMRQAKADVLKFVTHPSELDIWSQDYFLQLSKMIIYTRGY